MVKTSIYDRRTTRENDGPLLHALHGIAEPVRKSGDNEKEAAFEQKDHEIAIGHYGDDVNWKWLLENSAPRTVRIRVSSEGRYECRHQVTSKEIIELNLQPSCTNILTREWGIIIEEISKEGVAYDVVGDQIPETLRPYFSTGRHFMLTALAVLCQGYLAVKSPHFIGEFEGLFAKHIDSVKLLGEVSCSIWWRKVFIGRGDSELLLSEDAFKKEWPVPTDDSLKKHWTAVKSLVDVVLTENAEVGDSTVKSAFNALQMHLKGIQNQ